MSGENCVWKPSVINKKGEEVDSKLFNSLLRFSQNNREFAKKWYYIGTSEEFLEANRGKVQLDENGEITFNSLRKLANIDIKEELILEHLNAHLGNEAKDYNTAISLANSFNSSSEFKDDFVAIIGEVVDGKTRIQVVKKTESALAQHETNIKNKILFDRIKAAVERVGGSISFIDENYSRYSTENAKKLASGLYNVIQLAKKRLSSNSHEEVSDDLKGYTQEMKNILAKAPRNSEGRLLAPNGNPSNLTEKQYAQVRTKAFKRWFGDWENNPDNSSKVVDENGEPLVVYHGTNAEFTVFDTSKNDSSYKGFYFTDSKEMAGSYKGDILMPVFLNIRDYYKVNAEGKNWNNINTSIAGSNSSSPLEWLRNIVKQNSLELEAAKRGHYDDFAERYIKDEKRVKQVQDSLNNLGVTKLYNEYENIENSSPSSIIERAIKYFKLKTIEHKAAKLFNDNYYRYQTTSSVHTRDLEVVFSDRDGIIINDVIDYGSRVNNPIPSNVYIVYNPNQIKSATDNTGAFSSANDGIYDTDIYDTDTKISIEDAAEEAGHFAVGALGEDPLVKRLEALCSSKEVQQQILGEDYLDIQSRDNPVREIIGQLVGKHILGEVDKESNLDRLAERVKNKALQMFAKLRLDEVERAELEADYIAKKIAREFLIGSNKFNIDKALLNQETLYSSRDPNEIRVYKKVLQRFEILAQEMRSIDMHLGKYWKELESTIALGKSSLNNYNPSNRDVSIFAKMNALEGVTQALEILAAELPIIIQELDSVDTNPNHRIANFKKLRKIRTYCTNCVAIKATISSLIDDSESALSEPLLLRLKTANKILNDLITGDNRLQSNLLKKEKELYLAHLTELNGSKFVKNVSGILFDFKTFKLRKVEENSEVELATLIEELSVDDNLLTKWIDSMANSTDINNQLMYKAVSIAAHEADVEVLKAWDKIRELRAKAKALRINTKKFFERDSDGKITGNYISQYNWGDWEKAWIDFKTTAMETFKADPSIKNVSATEKEVLWIQYFSPLAKNWHRINSHFDVGSGKWTPSEDYRNSKYDDLTPTEQDFLTELLEFKASLDVLLTTITPDGSRVSNAHTNLFRMPQFRGSTQNRVENVLAEEHSLGKAAKIPLRQALLDICTVNSEDRDFGSAMTYNTLDEDIFNDRLSFEKEKISRVPLFGINKLKDMTELTSDLFNGLLQYAAMANSYKAQTSVVDFAEVAKDVLLERSVKGVKQEKERAADDHSRVYTRLVKFIDANVYNLYSSKQFWGQAALSKIGAFLSKMASYEFLGGNVAGGVVNALTGFNEIVKEAIAGQTFTLDELNKAKNIYFSNIGGVLVDMAGEVSDSKLSLFQKRFNIQNDLDSKVRDYSTRKSVIERLNPFGSNLLFPYKSGDHFMQTMSYLMAAQHYKFKDKTTGEEFNLWEAYELVPVDPMLPKAGSTLKLRDNIEYYDPKTNEYREWTLKDEGEFQILCRETNNKMHGIYNKMDKTALHKELYGGMILAMKGYALGMLSRRIGQSSYNTLLGRNVEGSLNTFGKATLMCFPFAGGKYKNIVPIITVMLCPFGKKSRSIFKNMGFNDDQFANMRRNWGDYMLIILLNLLKCLTEPPEDKEEDDIFALDDITNDISKTAQKFPILGIIYYFVSRLVKEQSAFNLPWGFYDESKTLFDYAPVGISVIKQNLDIAKLFITQERYIKDSGPNKADDLKWVSKVATYTPYYRTYRTLQYPYYAAESYQYGRATYK